MERRVDWGRGATQTLEATGSMGHSEILWGAESKKKSCDFGLRLRVRCWHDGERVQRKSCHGVPDCEAPSRLGRACLDDRRQWTTGRDVGRWQDIKDDGLSRGKAGT
jgi:hypothetical protein